MGVSKGNMDQYETLLREANEVKVKLKLESIDTAILIIMNDLLFHIRSQTS